MRHALICISLAVAGLALEGPSPAQADFCANFSNGSRNCGFRTFDQCLATISGVGGTCGAGPSGGGSAPSGGAWGAPERERQRIKAREEQRDPRERRAREREREQELKEKQVAPKQQPPKQAEPKQEPPSKPAPATAAPATPPPPAAVAAPAPSNVERKPSPADARVYFVGLQNGAEVPSELTVRFGVTNMGVAPAGLDNRNTGHHHLLIDASVPPLDQPIPNDFNHLHFGAGQTEGDITLPPGKHKLQLLFADENHVPHNPPVMSAPIEIIVKAKR